MVYYLIFGAILMVVSLSMIVWPRQTWRNARGWQFSSPKEVQLSAAYVAWLRLSGAVGVILAIVLLVYPFR